MNYSNRFEYDVIQFFASNGLTSYPYANDDITFNNNNIFRKFLYIPLPTVDSNESEFEIPSAHFDVIRNLYNTYGNCTPKEVFVPIIPHSRDSKSTFDAIFHSISRNKCLKVTIKDSIYYAGRGFILDKDFNPLLLCTKVCTCETDPIVSSPLHIVGNVARVSPKIFLNKNKTLEKALINKFIPYVTTNGIRYVGPCKIIIENIDRFFVSPVAPDIRNLDFNVILEENISSIIGQFN